MFNCHTHIFTYKDIPKDFLPFGLVRILASKTWSRRLAKALRWILPFSNNDILDHYARYIRMGRKSTSEKLLNTLIRKYDKIQGKLGMESLDPTTFIALAMDMQFMGAGNLGRGYEEQIKELIDLKQKNPERVIPFMAIDPRREGIYELFMKYLHKGLGGIKIYPALGYYPYDERLYPIYEKCQAEGIPVIAHCSRGGVYNRGKEKGWFKIRYEYSAKDNWKYTDPNNYHQLFDDFRSLKVCLAHYGGEQDWQDFYDGTDKFDSNWVEAINNLMENYTNIYTDISYTAHNEKFWYLLKDFTKDEDYGNRILFGTDFYMVEMDSSEMEFMKLYYFLGHDLFKKISCDNPKQFLFN